MLFCMFMLLYWSLNCNASTSSARHVFGCCFSQISLDLNGIHAFYERCSRSLSVHFITYTHMYSSNTFVPDGIKSVNSQECS